MAGLRARRGDGRRRRRGRGQARPQRAEADRDADGERGATAFSRGDLHAGTAPNGEGRKTPGATRRGWRGPRPAS
ncbi:hypothetical protein D9T17_10870 [Lysobacter enzymogenes]|uniref:Uncharacterized protein n=1 Tax=Lysobacter enzymogenes TaxID=69 RepID=A0A3N2RHN7_LYSEN|nr:hypothetical protein D9T17_10870 [Lysobacter enzymogenes]